MECGADITPLARGAGCHFTGHPHHQRKGPDAGQGEVRKSRSEVTSKPNPPGRGDRSQRWGLDHPAGRVRGAVARARSRGPGAHSTRAAWPRPSRPRRHPANRRPSPEEGVGTVVVDLGLGAAAARGRPARSARGRAVRRLLRRGLAPRHRGPRPRPLGAPALAPSHDARAPAAPPRALTPRTRVSARPREERREGVAAPAPQGLWRAEAGGGKKRAGGALWDL